VPVSTSHPTAEALVEAGVRLAEEKGLSQMAVDDVVARAGVAKGTFYVHFASRGEYLTTLHRRFHHDLERRINAVTAGLAPGSDRLVAGADAYLDGCLSGRAVKALLLEARSHPPVAEEVAKRNARFGGAAARDFVAMGWESPAEAGRLFVAMAADAALMELEAGRPLRAVRRTLRRFVVS